MSNAEAFRLSQPSCLRNLTKVPAAHHKSVPQMFC